MKYFIALAAFLTTIAGFSQKINRPLTKRIIVKTNLLSLIAQQPTITIEKVFSNNFSAEVAFVQGQFNNVLFTDHYDYHGFLLRAKKYFADAKDGAFSPYIAAYAGNLQRNIRTQGQTDNSGWFSYPSRNFSANSIRGGGTLGVSYFSKKRWVVDGLGSIGYGQYINIDKANSNTRSNGYLDLQIWLSVGYSF